MIVWILKALCLLNIIGFLYRLSLLFRSLIYLKELCLANWLGIFLVIICFLIIYIIYILLSSVIDQQQQIMKELAEIKYIIKELYDECGV